MPLRKSAAMIRVLVVAVKSTKPVAVLEIGADLIEIVQGIYRFVIMYECEVNPGTAGGSGRA